MKSDGITKIEKTQVRRAFERAALTYDAHATLQRFVVDNLLESLDLLRIAPGVIIDLGVGTGYCANALVARYPKANSICIDLSDAMLVQARQRMKRRWRRRDDFICADAENLPLATNSADFVFSSLTFQWCNDLDQTLVECARVLKPGGLLMFSSLGPDTLMELRNAWSAVDSRPRINQFIDMHDVGDAIIRAGFSSPVLECDHTTLTYDEVSGVMQDLRGIGAVNNITDRKRGLTTLGEYRVMSRAYEAFRKHGKLPATYEVIYAHAWASEKNSRPQDGSTVATFPLDSLKRRS